MIGRISGTLVVKQPPLLIIDVHGVGYEIEAPMSTIFNLPPLGEAVTLLTHFVVREDAQLLYGFATQAEKSLFREIIKISGIGPKLALAILSGIDVAEFWQVVSQGSAARLVKLPGIGKKTAERIIIEMRDKTGVSRAAGEVGSATLPAAFEAQPDPAMEARAALEALGYKPAEAQKLTDAVAADGMSTDQILREALRRAVR